MLPPNRRDEERRSKLLEKKKASIAARVRGVCAHMGAAEFDQLVERMAMLEIKYSVRRDEDMYRTRATGVTAWADKT